MAHKKDRHIMEALGKTRVVVEEGKVVEVGDPRTEYCPIFDKVRGIKKFTPETAKENVEFRIKDFGMFTENRELEMEMFVGFGASETFMTALRQRLIDASVTVCEGAGTVITNNPKLTQGMGSRVSGIMETSPIPKLIKRIEEAGGIVLDPKTAIIDQQSGVRKAIELGYKKIGVTVLKTKDAQKCRKIEKEHNAEVILFGVHTTSMEKEEAKQFVELVDMTAGCISKWVRKYVEGKVIAQFGTAIPIFAITQRGKKLLLRRAEEISAPILLNTVKLPVQPEKLQPRPLV
ncbi:MAG: methanogenesis marker 8 protein [Methanosarcinales archaeon]